MRPGRIRYLIVFFAAMFLANNAVASARACTVGPAAQEHTAIQVLDSSGDGHLCPDAGSADDSVAHCTQSYKSDQQNFSFDVPAVVFAPPLSVHRAWVPIEPRRLVIASAPPVVGPPLTILFGNLRI